MGKIATREFSSDSFLGFHGPVSNVEHTPLPLLLVQGGDDRLAVDPVTGLNTYGCTPIPRAEVIAFSSSTASSISEPAYRRTKIAKDGLTKDLSGRNADEALDSRIETARRALKAYLELNASGAEIVFSASGTDAQLHAHFLTRMLLGTPLTTIVLASDQTGSGTTYTSRRRHFSGITALGHTVTKGTVIGEGADNATSIEIALIGEDGKVRPAAEIDTAVTDAVCREIASGRKVLLQTMESSKLGWRAPSDACVQAITERWPNSVQVVVDACQLRTGRARLRCLLDHGAIVLITGSKFFMGPGFSGATLVPRALSDRLSDIGELPVGLAEYMTRFDVPPTWKRFRELLPPDVNIGAWLRWTAALEEMGAYYALPRPFAASQFARVGNVLADVISSAPSLELLREVGGCPLDGFDDELPLPTVFAFRVKSHDGYLQHDELVRLYRALNQDVSGLLPGWASTDERHIAARLCHIGQPVKLGGGRSVLRMALGARIASETWSADPQVIERCTQNVFEDCSTVVRKIDLLVHYGLAGK